VIAGTMHQILILTSNDTEENNIRH